MGEKVTRNIATYIRRRHEGEASYATIRAEVSKLFGVDVSDRAVMMYYEPFDQAREKAREYSRNSSHSPESRERERKYHRKYMRTYLQSHPDLRERTIRHASERYYLGRTIPLILSQTGPSSFEKLRDEINEKASFNFREETIANELEPLIRTGMVGFQRGKYSVDDNPRYVNVASLLRNLFNKRPSSNN